MNMNQEQIKTAARLLTEVACCTIDIHDEFTEGVQVCEAAVGYLAKDAPELLGSFKKATTEALQNKGGNYTTKQYSEKSDDLRRAIRLLETCAKTPDAPAEETVTLNKAARLIADFYDVETRGSAYFLTEQACFLIQGQGKDSEDAKICEQALCLIINGNAEQMQAFNKRTAATNYAPDADYDTEQYEGKKTDIRHAVADIMSFVGSPDITAEQKEMLEQAADMIAEFYGMGEELAGAA